MPLHDVSRFILDSHWDSVYFLVCVLLMICFVNKGEENKFAQKDLRKTLNSDDISVFQYDTKKSQSLK
jgi:hypothetical protein